jgi:hypothetical protein
MSRPWKLSRNKLMRNACREERQIYDFDVIIATSFNILKQIIPPLLSENACLPFQPGDSDGEDTLFKLTSSEHV